MKGKGWKAKKDEIFLFRYIIVFGKIYLLAEIDLFSLMCVRQKT